VKSGCLLRGFPLSGTIGRLRPTPLTQEVSGPVDVRVRPPASPRQLGRPAARALVVGHMVGQCELSLTNDLVVVCVVPRYYKQDYLSGVKPLRVRGRTD